MISRETLEERILIAFDSLGYKPRGFQPEVIYQIVDAFFNKGKQNVVCSLDTGAGKSIIGAVVAEVVDFFENSDDLGSIIMMSTNALAKQYADSFDKLEKYKYFAIKGARNYSCNFFDSQASCIEKMSGEDCVNTKILDKEKDMYCAGCEYLNAKKMINVTKNLITNNSYFLISALTTNRLKQRKLHVFDEAHNLNESFCSYTEITVSVDHINKYIKELSDIGKCDDQVAGLIMLKDKLNSEEIGHNNYKQALEVIKKIYSSISSNLYNQSQLLENVDIIKSAKLGKMSSKYSMFALKISELFDNQYDHVFDDTAPNTFTVKTIFVGKMMVKLLAKYNLLMSATITDNFVFDTLELDRNSTIFIDTEPVFPPENKPLFFIGKTSLNYAAMQDPDTITDLKKQIEVISNHHKDDSGLIIVPSFFLGSQLARLIKSHTVFEHKSGMNLPELIEDFKRYKNPGLLVSPSIFEGLDFKDDSSRFQIIVKSPYPSLGDRRIKHIADKYATIYQEMTLIKLIQGIGRSIRSESDFACTYFLDASSKKLFNSKLNIWKNRFTIQT